MPKRSRATASLPPDIVVQIQQDFGAQANRALALLAPSLPEAARVLRCVVFLADGDLELLSSLMTVAATDYRDVIFWAEYVNHAGTHPRHVRDLGRAFPHPGERGLPADVARFLRRRRRRRR